MNTALQGYAGRLEALAQSHGLDYYPVQFEEVPSSFMMEIAVYGLPVRMPHWSFGVRYIYQLVQHRMGHSRLFEVVFPGNPGRAYLAGNNSLQENTLVTAHVLGHADFAKNNALFKRSQEQVGYKIVEQAAAHARQIGAAVELYGQNRVEQVLDAALSLEAHIDSIQLLRRDRYPSYVEAARPVESGFQKRFDNLPGGAPAADAPLERLRAAIPPSPERDLLWFIAHYAPDLEQWERDIFLSVRAESLYFYPVFACQIMNEGWASYWHARLLREAEFLPQPLYLSAIKAHSDVVRPFAADEQTALQVNPYHLGFTLWERIVEQRGMDEARRICREEDDFGFVRNYLDRELAEKLDLFAFEAKNDGEIRVVTRDLNAIREAILSPKFNYGAPRIAATEMKQDGTLVLTHDHASDGRGLDVARGNRVIQYIRRVWRRPVRLNTVDSRGEPHELSA